VELIQTARSQKFSAIILNGDLDSAKRDKQLRYFMEEIDKNYMKKSPVFNDRRVYWPITGMRTRPQFIYVPRDVRNEDEF
jgi:hypothetical protein